MRRNVALWLERFLPLLLVSSVACAAALLITRGLRGNVALVWMVFAGTVLVCGVVAGLLAHKNFFKIGDAFVRLDVVMRLHNRLVSAAAGIGAWPARGEHRPQEFARWHWRRILPLTMLSMALLAGAALAPVPGLKIRHSPTESPLAWSQLDTWLQTLDQAKVVEPEALEKLHESLDELKKQAPEDWYRQSSLEAGDTLRQSTEQSLRELQRALQQTTDALTDAEKLGSEAPPSELTKIDETMREALRGLAAGNLPLKKELVNALKAIDASRMRQLSAEQLAQLREQLKAGTKVCEECVGPAAHDPNRDALLLAIQGQQPGGPGGGGTTAPLALKEQPTELHGQQSEGISNEDLSRAAPGQVLGVSKGEHEVKKTDAGAVSAGAISSTGAGGEAVWRNTLNPDEREVLQRFYK